MTPDIIPFLSQRNDIHPARDQVSVALYQLKVPSAKAETIPSVLLPPPVPS